MRALHGQSSFSFEKKLTPVKIDLALSVLYIDESPDTVSDLMRALDKQHPWEITHANNEKLALEIARAQPVDVALISATLPDTDIPSLATQLTTLHPKVSIFIFVEPTAGADQGFVSGRFQLLNKPCKPEIIMDAVTRMVTLVSWLTNNTTLELVSGIHSLPSIPSNYQGVIRTIQSPHSSFQEIGEAVNKDMAMTSRVLQVANSAYYGYTKKITNPTEAALFLGIETLKSLVRFSHLLNNFPHASAAGAIFDRVWRHSIGVASVARKITLAHTKSESLGEEAFTAGLLHDIGKLVLMSMKPDEYNEVFRTVAEGKAAGHLMERVKLGTTHAETGAYLLSLWGIPFDILEAVAWHHYPAESRMKTFSPLTAVHIANVAEHRRARPDRLQNAPQLDERYLRDVEVWEHVEEWLKLEPDKVRTEPELGKKYVVRPADPRPVAKSVNKIWFGAPMAAAVLWILWRLFR